MVKVFGSRLIEGFRFFNKRHGGTFEDSNNGNHEIEIYGVV
jgi:hypothetical protein